MDQRKQALTSWVAEQFPEHFQSNASRTQAELPVPVLQSLGSDAGFRRYFRLDISAQRPTALLDAPLQAAPLSTAPLFTAPLLAVDAPPETEDTALFVSLAKYLREQGIKAPMIIAADVEQGFLLVEDFGDRLLHRELMPDTADTLYGEALMVLLRLQQSTDIPASLPHYDQPMLRRELEIFVQWFVGELLNYSLTAQERILLDRLFEQLETCALEQPQLLVHRDYHSRNLLVCDSGCVGVIDFQGAVVGPFSYDLASLLRDCYIRWPADQVRRWALSYGNMAMEVGIIPKVNEAQFMRWFDWIGLQRHIKVLGIFARLHLRDGKAHYLAELPLVIRYLLEVANSYPQLNDFAQWFEQHLLPLAEQQNWYKDYRSAGDVSQ